MKRAHRRLRAVIFGLVFFAAAILFAPSATSVAIALPTPPVTSHAFVIEPIGTVPHDGDQRIPNLATPTGVSINRVPGCTQTFVAGPSVTAATVNRAIADLQNRMTLPETICLQGTFHAPIHVWGKYAPALLVIQSRPHYAATIALDTVQGSAVNANEYDGVAGGVSIVDSRGVEVKGLTVTGYHTAGTAQTPAGIYVEERAAGFGGTPSACFTHGDRACSDIFLVDNDITHIANLADTVDTSKQWCNNGNVDAFGIEVESLGRGSGGALQHVVIEGNTVAYTRTGQSETVAVNGDVKDFLVAKNHIYDTDNIGIDTEGWYNGTSQSRFGLVIGNVIANVDTWNNRAYGQWNPRTHSCSALQPNAAGIYDDGGSYIWIANNVVANTDQGISLDTENANRWTAHILVSGNHVWNSLGTRLGDPSYGPNPAGIPGRSTVAGHAYDALYIDAFGPHSSIFDVYAYNNVFQNASRYFGGIHRDPSDVVDIGGNWRSVVLWNNTIAGGGPQDGQVRLLGIDNLPATDQGTEINCTEYQGLSANTNFYLPGKSLLSLSNWQQGNGYHWDGRSTVNRSPGCRALY